MFLFENEIMIIKKCIICQRYYDNIKSEKCPNSNYKLNDIDNPVNILIKNIKANKVEYTIFCDDRREAEMLIKFINYNKQNVYIEIEELILLKFLFIF
jgi:hypothetical protein